VFDVQTVSAQCPHRSDKCQRLHAHIALASFRSACKEFQHNLGRLLILKFGVKTILGVGDDQATRADDLQGTQPSTLHELIQRINERCLAVLILCACGNMRDKIDRCLGCVGLSRGGGLRYIPAKLSYSIQQLQGHISFSAVERNSFCNRSKSDAIAN